MSATPDTIIIITPPPHAVTALRNKQNDWEGVRTLPYDDATGQQIKQSSFVKGNPSIGVGRNLNKPLSSAAVDFLWNEDFQEALAGANRFVWFKGLDEARQLAIIDMTFNLGYEKLSTFQQFLSLMEQGNYNAAADDLETTLWYKQVGRRAVYLTNVIRTGVWM
jgi:lysozyme